MLTTIRIPLEDILVDASGENKLHELPQATAIGQIKELYSFLGSTLEISLEEGEAVIRANTGQKSGTKISKLFDRAKKAADRGRYQQAAKLYQQYLVTVPDSVEVRRNLGMAYLEMGVVVKAEQHVIEALRVNPRDAWSNLLLGNIYLKHRNNHDIADNFYRRAAAADPNDPHLLSNLGSMVGQESKYDKARIWFNQVINIDPDLPNAYYGLALLEARQENHAAAIEVLDRLFSRPLSADIRSHPVYEESRKLYRQTNQSLAEENHETLMVLINDRRDEMESASGVEIELIRDKSLTVLARTQIAWHHRLTSSRKSGPGMAVPQRNHRSLDFSKFR